MSRFLIAALLCLLTFPAQAADHDLSVSIGGVTRHFSADELLKNAAATDIDIPKDAAYPKAMHYRALPLAVLLKDFTLPPDQILQAIASDGFTATLPADLARRAATSKGAVPYLAIEPPAQPWPKLKGKDTSAGPFYIVWLRPEKDDVRPEQWPYGVVKIAAADSPTKRWPALALVKTLPADAPVRAGQALFATNCMVCHKMNGAGDAEVGPDLNLPKNPVEYFKRDQLQAYIRDPSSLRSWKTMGMKGFGKDALSDREIDQIIAYLDYMAGRRPAAK